MTDQTRSVTPPVDLRYEEALEELEKLVAELDRGTVDVDTLGQRFQRAIEIIEELDGRINKTRQQVEQLLPRLDSAVGGTERPEND